MFAVGRELERSGAAALSPPSRCDEFALGFWDREGVQAFEMFKSACASRTAEIRDPFPVIPLEALKPNSLMINISRYNACKGVTHRCFPCSCQGNW